MHYLSFLHEVISGGGAPDPKICTLEKNQVQNYVCPAQDEDVCHTTGQGLPMTTTWQAEDDEVRLHRTGGWGGAVGSK